MANPVFDTIFPFWRQSIFWMPVYLFLLVFAIANFGRRSAMWCLFFIITVSVSDMISSGLVKDWVGRLRPCRDPAFVQHVRFILDYCPQSGSFTSSHACNHFAMAAFLVLTLKPYLKRYSWLFYAWAASVAFGQVYVGVHYPIDILGGGLLGWGLGAAGAVLYKKLFSLEVAAALKASS